MIKGIEAYNGRNGVSREVTAVIRSSTNIFNIKTSLSSPKTIKTDYKESDGNADYGLKYNTNTKLLIFNHLSCYYSLLK